MQPPPEGPAGAPSSASALAVEIVTRGALDVLVFSLNSSQFGRGADIAQATAFVQQRGGAKRCVFDLSGVEKIEGAFFGELLKLMKIVKLTGGTLKLCGLSKPLRDVLRVTKMERVFELCDSRDAALDQFGPA